ncbi:MAG TPA: protein-methionine-sulfoxide reductase heme-binding subunit MsrQ [Blastocatellia bacterium]|nr:protein-methionine-sulfoxide reductase heme-binding subunit MsrQ [Blastocatellia bacterium]
MQDTRFARLVVFVNGAVPLVLLAWDAAHNNLGANPVEFLTRTTGALALVFLVLSLAVTPLRKQLAQPWMVKLRRMLGLYSFVYASLHLMTYVWFDKSFSASAVVKDTFKRPFITFGMAAFLILVPLAITSTNSMVKRLGGKRWNRLHRLVYLAGALAVIHYYALVKADTREPIIFGVVIALLLLYRPLSKYIPGLVRQPRPAQRPSR